jgi:NADH dehydrogenase
MAAIRRSSRSADITVIDKSADHNFLPLLPDTLGRGIDPVFLAYPAIQLCKKFGCAFINSAVRSVDIDRRKVLTAGRSFEYDHLLIASGSETNFYGNDSIMVNSFKLDDARDSRMIKQALQKERRKTYVIAGAGYTGIEVATNIRRFLSSRGDESPVMIVERAPDILGPLPGWMKEYVKDNLARLNIEVIPNATIESLDNRKVILSTGRSFQDSMLIWAAGVRSADFVLSLKAQMNPQGRVIVDEYLRLRDNCFIAGDAACVAHGSGFLRMAVQFAITQGACAGRNIAASIEGKPLRKYKPLDLGYIIPMANNRACGIIMGKNFKGKFPTIMHYSMCLYRSLGMKNQAGIIKQLLTGR